MARLKRIPVYDHDTGSSSGAIRGKDKAAAGMKLADLDTIEYLEFILSHQTLKEPLTFWNQSVSVFFQLFFEDSFLYLLLL